jgi:hypothetical protein
MVSGVRGNMIHSRLSNVLLILLLLLSASTVASCQVGSKESLLIKKKSNDIQNVKILIAYQSKYGSIKQYAEWIQTESNGDTTPTSKNSEYLRKKPA